MTKKGQAPVHNVHGVKRILSTHDAEVLKSDIIEWLLNGYAKRQIIKFYVDTRGFTERYVEEKYNVALKEIKLRSSVDHEMIFHLHIDMYEQIFQYFEEIDNVYGKRKALYAKEKLLGLHKEETNVEINNTTNFELQTTPVYDVKKLTNEEQQKLTLILQKIGYNDTNK